MREGPQETTVLLRTADGLDLYTRRWDDAAVPHRWTLVVAHGLGEHSGRYLRLARWFTARGARVHAYDQRGHGRSGGPRGHANRLQDLLDDLDLVVSSAHHGDGAPVILVGHSFGGLIAIAYTIDRPTLLSGAIFSAPALLLKPRVPASKRVLGLVLTVLLPRWTLSNRVDPAVLSHDRSVAAAYANDPLVHDRISARLYQETFARGSEFIGRAAEVSIPFLLLHGADDALVDPLGSERFYATAGVAGRAFRLYPGLYHEIFNEPQQELVFGDILAWLQEGPVEAAGGWNPPP